MIDAFGVDRPDLEVGKRYDRTKRVAGGAAVAAPGGYVGYRGGMHAGMHAGNLAGKIAGKEGMGRANHIFGGAYGGAALGAGAGLAGGYKIGSSLVRRHQRRKHS